MVQSGRDSRRDHASGPRLNSPEIRLRVPPGALSEVTMTLRQMGQSMDGHGTNVGEQVNDVERIDGMLANAEARRNAVLREIDRHRSAVAERLRAAAEEIEDADFSEVSGTALARAAK